MQTDPVLRGHNHCQNQGVVPLAECLQLIFRYPDVLQDYNISTNITWSEAIVPAYLSDPKEEAEEEAESEEDGQGVVIQDGQP